MLDVNVLGLSVCTKQAFQSMKERGVDDGHIIHINRLNSLKSLRFALSINVAGHVPPGDSVAMYFATKHAVTALTEGLRREIIKLKSKIRVTSLSPGLVKTEMPPKEFLENHPALNAEDIADGVLYVLGTPPHVQVGRTFYTQATASHNPQSSMERWAGRVAVVTGASSGIGAAIAAELTKKGLKVVGLARRVERVQELSKSLETATGNLYTVKCDVSNEPEVLAAFKWVKDNVGGVDILINNAAVLYDTSLTSGSTEELKKMLDVNVLGLSVCTKQAFQSMKERGVDDGHIIHIN
ncbi:hypothetical protein Cfor_12660, partial [Coptotermes formosanus]